jgi:hypothetical protein
MNELRDRLRDGDPVVNEPPLSDVDALRMRRVIVAAGESRQSSIGDWARGSWAAVTVVIALAIAVSLSPWSRPLPERRNSNVDAPSLTSPELGTRRQVQLIAPGGTRVIWIFNDNFKP